MRPAPLKIGIGDRVEVNFGLSTGPGTVVGFHEERGADVDLDSGHYREQIPFACVRVISEPTAAELEAAGQATLFGESR